MFRQLMVPLSNDGWWRRSRGARWLACCLVGALASAPLIGGSAFAQSIEIVSQSFRGTSAEGRSNAPSLSFDGRVVAFGSTGLDLVAPAREIHRSDVFVRTRGEGASTQRIVVGIDGEVDGASQVGGFAPSISDDGRFVAFSSGATNLVNGDDNDADDIFVYNRDDGTTTRIEGVNGQPDAGSSFPRLSADGRWLVFTSQAANLVDGDDNESNDIFLVDRDSGAIRRVSVATDGTQADGSSRTPAISADGRIVAFISEATNLVERNTNGAEQVYVHDVESGQTGIVSVTTIGEASDGDCFLPDLSGDGRIVAFKSLGSNLVANDTNGVPDVFVHDRSDGTTERISVDSFGNQSNGLGGGPGISDDGRYVAFMSFDSTFDPDDGNGFSDVFVVDREADRDSIKRVTIELTSSPRPGGNVPDFPVTMSGNGHWIGFASAAENLAENDINNQVDAFVACNPFESENCTLTLPTETPTSTVTPTPTPGPAACTGDCNGDGDVSISELVRMTNIALGISICGDGTVAACPAGDANGDCSITVEELIRAVGNSLNGCTRFGELPLDVIIGICCPL